MIQTLRVKGKNMKRGAFVLGLLAVMCCGCSSTPKPSCEWYIIPADKEKSCIVPNSNASLVRSIKYDLRSLGWKVAVEESVEDHTTGTIGKKTDLKTTHRRNTAYGMYVSEWQTEYGFWMYDIKLVYNKTGEEVFYMYGRNYKTFDLFYNQMQQVFGGQETQ